MAKYFSHTKTYRYSKATGPLRPPTSLGELTPGRNPFTGDNMSFGGRGLPAPREGFAGRYYGGGSYAHEYDPRAFNPLPARRMFNHSRPGSEFGSFAAGLAFAAGYELGYAFADVMWGNVTQPVGGDFPFGSAAPDGWTLTCNVDPSTHPLETSRKMMTAPVPSTFGTTCNVSTVNRANVPWGSDIPAGSVAVSLVQSSAASPWPNKNGRPYWVITHPSSPASQAIKFGTRQAALLFRPENLVTSFPEDESPARERRRFKRLYQSFATQISVDGSGRPPTKSEVKHDHLPPPLGDKEHKPDNKAVRAVGRAYGAWTEVQDVVDCFAKSVKSWKRFGRRWSYGNHAPKVGLIAKARYAGQNGGSFSVPAFLECMALNEAGDRAIGFFAGRAARNFARSPYNTRRELGVGSGLSGVTRMR